MCWQPEGDVHPAQIKVSIAGTQCTPWSEMGLGLGMADPDTEPWHIWSSHMSQLGYDLTFLENSPRFPLAELGRKVEPDAHLISVVTGPELFGWPLRRQRLFTTAIRRSTMLWIGPDTNDGIMRDFAAIFRASIAVDASFFAGIDTDAQRKEFMRCLCERRGTWANGEHALQMRLQDLLPPGERRNLAKLKALADARPSRFVGCSGGCIGDVSQKPDVVTRCHYMMPPLLRNSRLVAMTAGCEPALLTPAEINFAHGWPTVPALENDSYRFVANSFAGLSVKEHQALTGNAMHLPAFTSWMLYVLAHCFPRAAAEALPRSVFERGSRDPDLGNRDIEFDFAGDTAP